MPPPGDPAPAPPKITTAAGAGAGAAEHQQDQHQPGQLGPQDIVRRGKTGGRNDRGHLEKGIAQALQGVLVYGKQVQRDHHSSRCNHPQEEAQLIALQRLLQAAVEHQKIHAEIDGEQQGKHRDDHIDHRTAVRSHAGVPV